jgi:hypothetical protein
MNLKTRKETRSWWTAIIPSVRLLGRRSPRRRRRAGPLVVAPALLLLGLPPLGGQAARASLPSSVPVTMSNCPNGVTGDTNSTAHFVVWACNDGPGAAVDESAALSLAESIYPPMISLMGAPLPDDNGKIDIYLLSSGQSLTRQGKTTSLPYTQTSCSAPPVGKVGSTRIDPATVQGTSASGYVVLPRPMLEQCTADFTSTLVHEYFHVLSLHYNTTTSCPKFWFSEASAVWAEWLFAHATAPIMVYPYFKDFQDEPGVSLTDSVNRSPYSDWMWPLFMQQHVGSPAVIAKTWQAMQGKVGCSVLNAVIDSQVSFAAHFGDFAVENFDSKLRNLDTHNRQWPVGFGPRYQTMDGGLPQKLPALVENPFVFSDKKVDPQTLAVNLPPLAAGYYEFSAGIDSSGIPAYGLSVDLSSITNRGNLDVTAIVAEAGTGKPYKRIDVTGNTLNICAARDNGHGFRLYLVLANHASTAGTSVGGSYTVTNHFECAKSVSGSTNYVYSQTITDSSSNQVINYKDTVALNNETFVEAPVSFILNTNQGSYNWAAVNTCTPTGSCGPNWDYTVGVVNHTYDIPDPAHCGYPPPYNCPSWWGAGLNAFDSSFAGSPPGQPGLFPVDLAAATASNGQLVVNEQSVQCPFDNTTNPYGWLLGTYDSSFTTLDFTCQSTSTTTSGTQTFKDQINVMGKLQATGVIPCGIWTSACSVTAANPRIAGRTLRRMRRP